MDYTLKLFTDCGDGHAPLCLTMTFIAKNTSYLFTLSNREFLFYIKKKFN